MVRQLLSSSLFILTAVCQETGGKVNTLVSTSLGLVQGSEGKTEVGTPYAKYTKVPYAEPPTGVLRLRDPVRKKPGAPSWTPRKFRRPVSNLKAWAGQTP